MILERIKRKIKNLDYSYLLILVIGVIAAIYGYGFLATLQTVLIFGTSFILTDFILWILKFGIKSEIKFKNLIIPVVFIILDSIFMNMWGLKMTVGLTAVWVVVIGVVKYLK